MNCQIEYEATLKFQLFTAYLEQNNHSEGILLYSILVIMIYHR